MPMSEPFKGVLAMLACSSIWGLSGIYYKWLLHVPALEVIAHRTLWSMVFFGFLILIQGRLHEIFGVFRNPRLLAMLFLGAMLISVNWTGFVLSIHNGWAIEASLGYYILPLLAVLLGVFLLGERLSRLQAAAVLLAAIAVVILAVGLGATPWVALLLATSFALYGLIKRKIDVGPILSVFIEVLLVAPIALGFLLWTHRSDAGAFGENWGTSLLLVGAGPMTAVPLILFTYAARRVNFATVGLIQYLNPSLQFLIAVFLFGEIFTKWHAIALPIIWVALGLYSFSSFRNRHKNAAKPVV